LADPGCLINFTDCALTVEETRQDHETLRLGVDL
jgi:hypothetical protein